MEVSGNFIVSNGFGQPHEWVGRGVGLSLPLSTILLIAFVLTVLDAVRDDLKAAHLEGEVHELPAKGFPNVLQKRS